MEFIMLGYGLYRAFKSFRAYARVPTGACTPIYKEEGDYRYGLHIEPLLLSIKLHDLVGRRRHQRYIHTEAGSETIDTEENLENGHYDEELDCGGCTTADHLYVFPNRSTESIISLSAEDRRGFNAWARKKDWTRFDTVVLDFGPKLPPSAPISSAVSQCASVDTDISQPNCINTAISQSAAPCTLMHQTASPIEIPLKLVDSGVSMPALVEHDEPADDAVSDAGSDIGSTDNESIGPDVSSLCNSPPRSRAPSVASDIHRPVSPFMVFGTIAQPHSRIPLSAFEKKEKSGFVSKVGQVWAKTKEAARKVKLA